MTHRPIATALLATALLATLGACGQREDLKPVADQAPPVTPVGATRPPTNEELTTPDAQAMPARSDELLKRSEQREPDDFDLPPPGRTSKPVVFFFRSRRACRSTVFREERSLDKLRANGSKISGSVCGPFSISRWRPPRRRHSAAAYRRRDRYPRLCLFPRDARTPCAGVPRCAEGRAEEAHCLCDQVQSQPRRAARLGAAGLWR